MENASEVLKCFQGTNNNNNKNENENKEEVVGENGVKNVQPFWLMSGSHGMGAGFVGENGRKMEAQSRIYVLAGHLKRKSQEIPAENAICFLYYIFLYNFLYYP